MKDEMAIKKGLAFTLLTQLITLLGLVVFGFFVWIILRENQALFKNSFLLPFSGQMFQALLIIGMTSLIATPISQAIYNFSLKSLPAKKRQVMTLWHWLVFYLLTELITFSLLWLMVLVMYLWDPGNGALANQFYERLAEKIMIPFLVILIFGLGAASLIGASFNNSQKKLEAAEQAE